MCVGFADAAYLAVDLSAHNNAPNPEALGSAHFNFNLTAAVRSAFKRKMEVEKRALPLGPPSNLQQTVEEICTLLKAPLFLHLDEVSAIHGWYAPGKGNEPVSVFLYPLVRFVAT